jgi:hypothetical protein
MRGSGAPRAGQMSSASRAASRASAVGPGSATPRGRALVELPVARSRGRPRSSTSNRSWRARTGLRRLSGAGGASAPAPGARSTPPSSGSSPRRDEGACSGRHANAAGRDLGIVEMELRHALFAGDGQGSPALPRREPCTRVARPSAGRSFRPSGVSRPAFRAADAPLETSGGAPAAPRAEARDTAAPCLATVVIVTGKGAPGRPPWPPRWRSPRPAPANIAAGQSGATADPSSLPGAPPAAMPAPRIHMASPRCRSIPSRSANTWRCSSA